MRISARQSMAEEEAFALAETMADLGYHTRIGSQISAVPDVEFPWDPAIVKKIRREFDPAWTPLFCREAWMTPNKGRVVIGRHMVGRHVPIPRTDVDVLQILRPLRAPWGVSIKTPILEAMTLEIRDHPADCRCESCRVEKDSGGMVRKDLGEYVPFDDRLYHTCYAIWRQNHSMRPKELAKELVYLQVQKPKEESAKAMENLRDELKSDWPWLERKRLAETDYDRERSMAPPPTRPSFVLDSGGIPCP